MVCRQSDGRIVPVKARSFKSISAGGKIGHLINKKLLKECHEEMDGAKAVGIDGITKEEYGRNLEENLDDLMNRLRRRAYHPRAARRVEIPKDNGKTRPLSIYCYEDKLGT